MRAHDDDDQQLNGLARRSLEKFRDAELAWRLRRIAVEHLEGTHRTTVGFLEPIGMAQGSRAAELVEHRVLDRALAAEALEHRVCAGLVLFVEQAKRVESLGELVEEKVFGTVVLVLQLGPRWRKSLNRHMWTVFLSGRPRPGNREISRRSRPA